MNEQLGTIIFCGIRRFIETIMTCAVLSAIATGICVSGMVPANNAAYFFCFGAAMLVFVILNVRFMLHSYIGIEGKKEYYIANYAAYGLFVLINIILFIIHNGEVYTWTFGITKLLKYCPPHLSVLISMVLFHLLMAALIAVVPHIADRMIGPGEPDEENEPIETVETV